MIVKILLASIDSATPAFMSCTLLRHARDHLLMIADRKHYTVVLMIRMMRVRYEDNRQKKNRLKGTAHELRPISFIFVLARVLPV
jgi:hypothetical protein